MIEFYGGNIEYPYIDEFNWTYSGKWEPCPRYFQEDLEVSRKSGCFIALEEMVTDHEGWVIERGEPALLWEDMVFLDIQEVEDYLAFLETERQQARENQTYQMQLL